MYNLPPLTALRAFEVAARTGSFTAAGAELGVTSAAVSLQVKHLESHLGKRLFNRQGNRIVLTDAGRGIYPKIGQAFADLAATSATVSGTKTRSQLVISVLPSMAETWLTPRLAKFSTEASLDIRVEDDPVSFSEDRIDLRLTYDGAVYPDFVITPLFSDQFVPVCTPTHRAANTAGMSDLSHRDFIHTDWGPAFAAQPEWQVWMASAGFPTAPDPQSGLRVNLSSLAINAACQGLGVALVPLHLAANAISRDDLVVAHPFALPVASNYVMVHPNALARKKVLTELRQHLLSAV